MIKNIFTEQLQKAYKEKRRLVAPLIGAPGLNITESTIKLAQQNYGEHFKALNAIAKTFSPDIIFPLMDLSVEANAIGCYTLFPKEESATVMKEHFDNDKITRLEKINIAYDTRLLGYIETVKLMSINLPKNIMRGAYVAGPYSLSSLMIGAEEAAMATVTNEDYLKRICDIATKRIQKYIHLLIAAGVQIICILEPTAVLLGPDQFQQFSASYIRYINESLKFTGVTTMYHVCGNATHLIENMSQTGVDILSLDSAHVGVDLPAVAKQIPQETTILGNINPTGSILTGSPADVKSEVNSLLDSMDPYPNFILGTGCDLPQDTPIENIHAFMKAGRNYRIK